MAGGSVGNAYLNVVPKIDQGAAAAAGSQAGGAMSGGLKGAISAGAVAIGNIISSAAISAAQTLGSELSKTFTNYADYQQLTGGVEKLFGKEAAATVKANAQDAFQSAGMSANEYMENVTSFSASLINSLGGDTQAAADAANMAMKDIADNANTYGTYSAQELANVYQNLAKGQFSTLDNLNLGFGGTKEGMQQLIDKANQLKEANGEMGDLTIDSFSDMVEAIHLVQTDMNITGTTANEAAGTISGSIGMAKAAWENFLTAIGDGGKTIDMSKAMGDLVSSVGAMLHNIVPEVVTIIGTIGQLVLDALPDSIGGPLGEIASGIGQALQTIGNIAKTIIVPVFGVLSNAVMSAMGVILPAIQAVIDFVNSNVLPTVQSVVAYLMPMIQQVLAGLSSNFNSALAIVQSVMGAIGNIILTLWPVIQSTITVAVTYIGTVIRTVWPVVQQLITSAMNNIRAVAAVVWPFIQSAVQVAATVITAALDGLSSIIANVESTFNRIKDAITNPIETAKNFVSNGVNRIKDIINNAHLKLPDIKVPHFNINGGEIPWGIGGKGYPPSISIDWYARGGYVDGATLIGAGERGGELIWPSYAPYLDRYAEAIASQMPNDGGTVYIDGARVNDDQAIQGAILNLFDVLMRRGAMNVGTV